MKKQANESAKQKEDEGKKQSERVEIKTNQIEWNKKKFEAHAKYCVCSSARHTSLQAID